MLIFKLATGLLLTFRGHTVQVEEDPCGLNNIVLHFSHRQLHLQESPLAHHHLLDMCLMCGRVIAECHPAFAFVQVNSHGCSIESDNCLKLVTDSNACCTFTLQHVVNECTTCLHDNGCYNVSCYAMCVLKSTGLQAACTSNFQGMTTGILLARKGNLRSHQEQLSQALPLHTVW